MSDKGVSRRKKTKSKVSLLLASLLLILSFSIFGSISYLISRSDVVTNTFTPGKIDPGVNEEFDGTIKENVTISNGNNANVKAYVRAAIVVNWVSSTKDENGEYSTILPETPSAGADGDYSIELDLQNGWVEGEDGYYYWTKPVEPGSETGILIEKCEQLKKKENAFLSVEILAQGIQAEPADAVVDAWKIVEVNSDGSLTVQSSTN